MVQVTVQQAFDLAFEHLRFGRLSEAEGIYRQILARDPKHADALHLLGVVAFKMRRHDAAVDLIRQALVFKPRNPDAYNNLGNVLKDQGRLEEAVAAYRQALVLNDRSAEIHSNLSAALWENGQLEEAIASCRRAIVMKPGFAEAHSNLGNALRDRGELDEAIAAFRDAIALRPEYVQAYSNLGSVLADKGDFGEAAVAYRKAIALHSDFPDAHANFGELLLMQGEFLQGWKEYEWRLRCKKAASRWNFSQPQWDGGDLDGRTILVCAEQGLGDAIQFIRYVPMVAARGGKVVVKCFPELRGLLGGTAGVTHWLGADELWPAFDVYCPLLSLPLLFGTNAGNVPQSVPYVRADAEKVEWWRRELAGDARGFKVGLVWAGNPKHKNDRNRSIGVAALAPLAQVRGMSFYSLQKGKAGEQVREASTSGLEVIDRTEELKDFADTAGLMANLDLVICVDTAVAHLAGAMGKEVWTMLPFVPDWRWGMEGEGSLWYPTMRLFRQPSMGDWGSVVRQVAESLASLVGVGGQVTNILPSRSEE